MQIHVDTGIEKDQQRLGKVRTVKEHASFPRGLGMKELEWGTLWDRVKEAITLSHSEEK